MTIPTPAADSYGNAAGVAALARTWTLNSEWVDPNEDYDIRGTNPTLTTVVRWIDQVSAMLNTALGSYGFVVPLTDPMAVLAAETIVEEITAALADFVNNTGSFYASAANGQSLWSLIGEELDKWVLTYAPGLEQNGAERTESNVYKIGTRGFDNQGDEIFPIFQRKGFGNRFENWDSKR